MRVLSLDLELNQPSGKVISVGAAVFEASTGKLLDKIELFVNPEEPVSQYITELTGITNSDVSNGMSALEAYGELKRFHKKYKCIKNPIVWGSGVWNDSLHLYKEAGTEEENFMGHRVLDAKTLYQSQQVYLGGRLKANLVDTCKNLGIEFEGKPHTALADAINTFKVWYYLVKKLS